MTLAGIVGSDNANPKIIFEERLSDGSDTPNPPADHRSLFLGEDGLFHWRDSAGTVTDLTVAGVTAHLADTVDAHDASAISFSPNGSIGSTDVQAAIQEVRDEASGGAAAYVSAHGARVKRSADLSVGNNTYTLMAWTAEDHDTDTIHDNSTNNSRLTIPTISGVTNGLWEVRCFGYTNQHNINGRTDVSLRLNAAGSSAGGTAIGFGSTITVSAFAAAIQGFLAACQYVFAAGDYVEAFVRTTGGTYSAIFDGGVSPIFEIAFLGKVS